jgi:esterase
MRLFFRKYGNGPVLVILHGLYGSSDNWVSIAGKLSDSFTVILPDLRNHGLSFHSNIHNYDALSQDVFGLLEELNIKRFILAGHSMGGKVAMSFALKWPDLLSGLIIVDISPFGSTDPVNPFFTEHREILEAIVAVNPEEYKSRAEVEKVLSASITSERTRSFIMKNLKRHETGYFRWKLNAASLLKNLGEITRGIAEPGDSGTSITGFPVKFIRGENSSYIDKGTEKNIYSIFPTAEIIEIRGAGHWVHAEKPDEVTEIFLGLLKGN